MKVVMIHQPHFFPWLGYFNKLLNVDHCIVLDDVQYRPRYYQNKTKILHKNGNSVWLTIPIKANRNTMICDALIVEGKWRKKFIETIKQSYSKADFFYDYWDIIEKNINNQEKCLLNYNYESLKDIMSILGNSNLEFSLSSQHKITPTDPNDRLIKLCKSVNATHYLFGEGNGINYHDVKMFNSNNICTLQQNFLKNHPKYKQQSQGFTPGLSIIDSLLNIGQQKTAELTLKSWEINKKGVCNE